MNIDWSTLVISSISSITTYFIGLRKSRKEIESITLINLEKYILTRGKLESSTFELAEKNTRVMRDAWLKALQKAQNTEGIPNP